MADVLLICDNCKTKNRLPPGKSGRPKCGHCGFPLTIEAHYNTFRFSNLLENFFSKKSICFLLFITFIFALAYYKKDVASQYSDLQRTNAPETQRLGSATYSGMVQDPVAPLSIITSSVVQQPRAPAVAPLLIITPAGNDYFFKLVDASGGIVISMLVRGGDNYETRVPVGSFEMRYAYGKTWYGANLLFGNATEYAKLDEKLFFYQDGNKYVGLTIKLIEQPGGNIRKRRINSSGF